jgi:hypothetical protein
MSASTYSLVFGLFALKPLCSLRSGLLMSTTASSQQLNSIYLPSITTSSSTDLLLRTGFKPGNSLITAAAEHCGLSVAIQCVSQTQRTYRCAVSAGASQLQYCVCTATHVDTRLTATSVSQCRTNDSTCKVRKVQIAHIRCCMHTVYAIVQAGTVCTHFSARRLALLLILLLLCTGAPSLALNGVTALTVSDLAVTALAAALLCFL